MKTLIITLLVALAGCVHPGPRQSYGNHGRSLAEVFGAVASGVQTGMQTANSGHSSTTYLPHPGGKSGEQLQSAPASFKRTDYKCMADCKAANYRTSTCDNMCTGN